MENSIKIYDYFNGEVRVGCNKFVLIRGNLYSEKFII